LLDQYYNQITVLFFYECSDKGVLDSLKISLADPSFEDKIGPIAGVTYSRKNFGCIVFFLKHYKDTIEGRTDIAEIGPYTKNGVFEEFCHLVEQEGDSSIHSNDYWQLWKRYANAGQLSFGNEIIHRLDTDRNHYTVYQMMLHAYPDDWVRRYGRYYVNTTPDRYQQLYYSSKENLPTNVLHARLVTDYLRTLNVLFVCQKASNENISTECKSLLDKLTSDGTNDLLTKKKLIEKEMGTLALALIESINEPVFSNPQIFFMIVLDLWVKLRLI
jgi:hypothetical protein